MVLWSIALVALAAALVWALHLDHKSRTGRIGLHPSERAESELAQGSRTVWNNHTHEIGTTGSGGPL